MTGHASQFIWYELMTPDPDAAKAFYDAVVGWDIAPKPDGEMDYRMIRRSDGGQAGGVLHLTGAMVHAGARPAWVGYLSVPDVDAAISAIAADHASLLMPPMTMPGVGRMAMAADPDGAPFYLMTPEPPAGQPDAVSDAFSVDRPQHVRWNELAAADADQAVAFYTRHFGWRQEGEMPMGPLGAYRFLWREDVMIGAIMPKPAETERAAWTFYIGVEDIDDAASAVTAGGGMIVQGPQEIPGGEYSLDALDPQGAHFGLVGPRRT